MTKELTDSERALLAREIAIDEHGYRNYGYTAFTDGWDAAMAYLAQQPNRFTYCSTCCLYYEHGAEHLCERAAGVPV